MDNLLLGMFKLYDIRTKEQNLTEEIREHLYNAIVLYYKENLKATSVVICRDARLYVPQLVEGLTLVFNKAGIDVLMNPLPISTCQFYYTCMKHKESAGIMVTASHNPGEYVGMKLMAPGLLPIAYGNGPEGGIEKIKVNYVAAAAAPCAKTSGKVIVVNELDSYINYSMELAGVTEGSLKGLRVCLTS